MTDKLILDGNDVDACRQQVLRAIRDEVVRHRTDKRPWVFPAFDAIRDAADAGAKDRIWRMEAAGFVDGVRHAMMRLRSSFVLPQGLPMQPIIDVLMQVYQVLECEDMKAIEHEMSGVSRNLDVLKRNRPE